MEPFTAVGAVGLRGPLQHEAPRSSDSSVQEPFCRKGTMNLAITSSIDSLRVEMIDGEPRVRDIDLAVALGFAKPRTIRDLIARNLNKNDIYRTVGQNEDPQGRGRPGHEYWLTEEQALFIVTKSETPKALEITRTIVRVFRAAVRGELIPRESETRVVLDTIREIGQQLVALRRDVDGMIALSTGTEDSPHCIGTSHARRLLARIKAVAVASSEQVPGSNKQRLVASLRKSFEIEVRARIGFDGPGTRWERLPASKHAAAYLAIEAIGDRERKRAKALGLDEVRQMPLRKVS